MTTETESPDAPPVHGSPVWVRGVCASCGGRRTRACLEVAGELLCATCVWLCAQAQINRESVASGAAPQVPAPAGAGWGLPHVPHAYVHCEGCIPIPTAPAAWVAEAGLWLCPGCVADIAAAVARRVRARAKQAG